MDHAGHLEVESGCALDRFRTPVGAHVAEAGGGAGQQVAEEHRHAVERIVFGGDHERFTDAVPVERGVEHGFKEVAVGHVVGPLPLALESGGDGVVALGLLAESLLGQLRIADHQVAGDDRHLGDIFPHLLLLFRRLARFAVVDILILAAVRLDPGERLLIFRLVVDLLVDPADDFAHIDRFAAHVEVFLEEFGADDRTGDAHGDAAHREIGLAAHQADRHRRTGEGEDLCGDIFRNLGIGGVLHIAPVDAERGQSLLGVGGEHRRQIDRAGPLGAVESPDRLLGQGIHVHRFGAVAPAGGDGQRRGDVLFGELRRTGGRFIDAADGGVGDDAFDRFAVGVAQRAADEFRSGLRHVHRLDLKGFTDPFAAAVDGGADSDFRQSGNHFFTSLVEG